MSPAIFDPEFRKTGPAAERASSGAGASELSALPSAGDIMTTTRKDPADEMRMLRLFYQGWHPTRLGKLVNSASAWISGLGLTPQILLTLQVKGRTSGRLRANIIAPVSYGGQRYLVSMLGNDSEWVRNVRAAGGEAFIKRGRAYPVMLTEIPCDERAPILKAYCQVATSGRNHFPVPYTAQLSEFEAIAADYPVFRVDVAARAWSGTGDREHSRGHPSRRTPMFAHAPVPGTQLLRESIGWGIALWFIGYVLGIILFFVLPAGTLGWAIMPIGVVITLWVLLNKVKGNTLAYYAMLGIIWTAIAVTFDYLFIVTMFRPVDGYYKLDVYLYYAFTFVIPLAVGWWKNSRSMAVQRAS